MKHNYLKSLFLMLMMCVGMSAWGEVVTLTENFSSSKATSDNYDCSSAITTEANRKDWDYSWSYEGSGTCFKNGIKLGAKSSTGSVTNNDMLKEIPAGTSVTVKVYAAVWNTDGGKVSFTYDGSTDTEDAANVAITTTNSAYAASAFTKSTDFKITKKDNDDSFTIASSAKRIIIDKVEVVYETGGTTEPPVTTTYNVTIDSNISNGTVSADPTTAEAGATINLTATPATGYEFDSWNVTNASTSATITVTDNKFTMPAANVNVSATFNNVKALSTMDEIYSKAQEVKGTATDVRVTFDNWVISGLNGTKNAYLTDGTKGLIIFDNGSAHGFKAGDILNGTVTCEVQLYNGSAELTSLTSTTEGLTVTKGGSVAEQSIAIADLSGINTGALLSYENLTYHLNGTDAEFSDGENVIVAYKGIMNTLPELIEGKTYDVKGIFLMYGSKKEILPRSAEDIVLKEVINTYIVTFDATENGTIVVMKDGKTVINEGDEVAEGTELTIECTPASEDHRFKNWQYKAGDASWATRTTDFTYTMPSANVQFRANFELIPTYTIAWSVNGTTVKSEDLKEGSTVTAPADPIAINGKVFTGWIETATVEGETPAYVTPSAIATKTVTYYAVFATKTGEESNGTSTLTREGISTNIMATAMGYADDERVYNDGKITWTVKGFSQSANADYIQIRKNDILSYIKIEAPATINNLTFEGHTTTGANFAGTIYLTTDPTKDPQNDNNVVGNTNMTNKAGTISSLVGNNNVLYIQSSSAVRLYNITVTYGTPATYSDFTTTVAEPTTETLAFKATTDNTHYWATFSHKENVVIPDMSEIDGEYAQITVYSVNVEAETLALSNLSNDCNDGENWNLPKNNGYLIECEFTGSNAPSVNYTFAEESMGTAPTSNLLKPATATMDGDCKFYKLSKSEGKLGFFYGATDGAAFTMTNSNGAYLAVPNNIQVKAFTLDAIETAIQNVEMKKYDTKIYNLQGQRVDKAQKGIYIINGRKVVK